MRIVVIGNGMVGSRFAADAAARIPRARITVLGREDCEPYNRVLLSSVVAGTVQPGGIAMPGPEGDRVHVRRGVAAVSIRRTRRTVLAADGSVHPYDRLVLAMGSSARIPPIHHVADPRGLVGGVHVLKDLADARGILAQLPRTRRAVVLGAGVLGLEVATGLAARGKAVTLAHQADRLMERQLGAAASRVAAASLRRLGIDVLTGASVTRVTAKRRRIRAVELSTGAQLPCDLLVMCAGTVPETALARQAGLAIDRGVLVNDSLASPTDGSVYAIGDCAQPPEGGTGLVAQGWDQAARLVDEWSGKTQAAPAAAATADVVRVKSTGLDLVTMGRSTPPADDSGGLRAVRISDPAVGRFVEVVVSDGVLVGATVVGDSTTAADLQAHYTRMLPVPTDPAHLIVRPLAAAAADDATGIGGGSPSGDATVCRCNGVSAGRIRSAVADGCRTVADVADATRAGTGCGDCRVLIADLIAAANQEHQNRPPALAGTKEG
jgi:NAD(P)H-nitrite reductase large subunit